MDKYERLYLLHKQSIESFIRLLYYGTYLKIDTERLLRDYRETEDENARNAAFKVLLVHAPHVFSFEDLITQANNGNQRIRRKVRLLLLDNFPKDIPDDILLSFNISGDDVLYEKTYDVYELRHPDTVFPTNFALEEWGFVVKEFVDITDDRNYTNPPSLGEPIEEVLCP